MHMCVHKVYLYCLRDRTDHADVVDVAQPEEWLDHAPTPYSTLLQLKLGRIVPVPSIGCREGRFEFAREKRKVVRGNTSVQYWILGTSYVYIVCIHIYCVHVHENICT